MIDPHRLPALPELMIAGPGELHEDDLALMGHQVIAHYGDVWTELHSRTLGALQTILGADSAPYLIPGTGTTCLEMALLNLFEPGQRVVVTDTGFFGDRLKQIALALGLEATMFPVPTGQAVDAEALADLVHGAAGVLTTHVETSTGVRHPVEQIARVAHDAGAICVVDGIASAGGESISIGSMGIDAIVTATQKGLEAPPGLGVIAFGPGGTDRVSARSRRPASWYMDLAVWDKYREEWGSWHPHPVTMPTNLVLALAGSLDRILTTGTEEWVTARRNLAESCRSGLAGLGYESVPSPGVGANLVVAVWADDPVRIQKHLAAEGLMVSGGLGPTHDKAIRIGLMGRTANSTHVRRLLDALASL